MQRYKPKPVPPPTVEAVQITPENAAEIAEWAKGLMITVPLNDGTHISVVVETSVGRRRAEVSDYLIKDEAGLFTVLPQAQFEAQFETIPTPPEEAP